MSKKHYCTIFLFPIIAFLIVACKPNSAQIHIAYFLIGTEGHPSYDGYFIVKTSNPGLIEKARSQLSALGDDRLFVDGILNEGDGGYNVGWSWHFDPNRWDLVESTIELCDASPRLVEESVDEWIGSQFCPWSSYVLAELAPGPQ